MPSEMPIVRIALIVLLAFGMVPTGPALAADRPVVVALNGPLAYFAGRLGGDAVDVGLPVPEGLDPADWRPDDSAIAVLQQADLILRNGAGYSPWIRTVAIPRYRVIDTSRHLHDRYIALDGTTTHAHGPEGEHTHAGHASTTWLDLGLAAEQARVVAKALAMLVPDREAAIQSELAALQEDLSKLDAQARLLGAAAQGKTVMASHPVYQYFGRAYGIDIANMHWEPEQTPDAAEWAAFDAARGDADAVVMLWEAPPNEATAAELAARNVTIVVFDPAGGRRDRAFPEIMRANLANLAAVLQ